MQRKTVAKYIIRSAVLGALGAMVIGVGIVYGNEIRGKAVWINLSLVSLGGGMMGLIISALNYKRFMAPMKGIISHIQAIADGDLTARLDEDKVGELKPIAVSINQMVGTWENVLGHVNETAHQTAALSEQLAASAAESTQAANQIAASIHEVATGAEMQARGAEESKKALEEMAGGIQRVAESSSVVSEASLEMSQQAEQGNHSVQQAVQQMDSIQAAVTHSAAVVKHLGERSEAIGQIVEVITGIASQTNLLALNAAIEAARAGEHGRGFAVVADEVRKLAEQSEASAGQIAALIQEIQADTAKAVKSMDEGMEEVQSGMELFRTAGISFSRIVNASQQVAGQIQEISAASQQMSAGSEQVLASVEQMTSIAKQSETHSLQVASASEEQLASMEQIARSASSLSEHALELQELISKFKISR
ncbi:methyl-accepting chemotaxis protein [Effusibacillus lacus]|uniref:methyl-accepting chemotaxis protein n=1 Tax=Effusibacillus lacus TaxID=1348429 RepID=UPI000BB99BDD|nr:HAMP domain-containing methyl-accepting chemotaxis protein [Effusibacillus lacus]